MPKGQVVAIVGAQLGSEGKGSVARYLADEFDVAVRTGAPNAGHTIFHEGSVYKMQSIPCTWTNPKCELVIGRGALINVEIFLREVAWIRKYDPNIDERLIVDSHAGILTERHHTMEGGVDGHMHKTMGSTGEGVGAARADRMARDPKKFHFAKDVDVLAKWTRSDTPGYLADHRRNGSRIMLEGTQGAGLSLIHGSWPHVTSNDTNAAQMAADAGIPPQHIDEVILVARTYPIRVAGPSGPMKGEKTWEEMSDIVGKKVEERTTVTNKLRRIGEWDEDLLQSAVTLNAPTSIAITFLDYLCPEDIGKTSIKNLSTKAREFINYVSRTFGMVELIGTGWDPKVGWSCIDLRSLTKGKKTA